MPDMTLEDSKEINDAWSVSDRLELPDGWVVASIEELCDLNPKHDRNLSDDTLVSFVPMAAVSDTEGKIFDATIRPFGEVRRGFTQFADGDVIFAKITPCMENGKAASVRELENGLGCGTTEFYVFRQRGGLNQDYLFYFVRQESYRRLARAQMQSGVGQARVPKDFVLSTELPVPPKNEQTRIVTAIESLQQRSARARDLLTEVQPLLTRLRQSILQAAFSGRLTADWRAKNPDVEPADRLLARIRTERRQRWETDQLEQFKAKGKKPPKNWKDRYKEPEPVDDSELPELPEGWCWEALEAMVPAEFPIVYGIIQAGPHIPDGIPYIRPADIQNSTVDLDELPRTTIEIAAKYERAALKAGDLIFSVVGTIGKTLIVDNCLDGANITQSSVRIRMFKPFSATMILRSLQSPLTTRQMELMQFGNAVQRLNVEHMRRLAIPVPPLEEWEQLHGLLETSFGRLELVEYGGKSKLQMLSKLDQSILSKAFCGELVPQDSNDEPAAELLARIRATREAEQMKKKASKKKKSKKKATRKPK